MHNRMHDRGLGQRMFSAAQLLVCERPAQRECTQGALLHTGLLGCQRSLASGAASRHAVCEDNKLVAATVPI